MADVGNTVSTAKGLHLVNGGYFADSKIDYVGDTDWFKIKLHQGEVWTFSAITSFAPGLPDPFLRLRDANGVSLAFNDDNGHNLNSLIYNYTAPYSGRYFLSVGSAVTGSGTGWYQLHGDHNQIAKSDVLVFHPHLHLGHHSGDHAASGMSSDAAPATEVASTLPDADTFATLAASDGFNL